MKINHFSMPNPQEMQALIDFCKVMASSPFYQKLGPGGVMAIYLTAKEYDLPFMACLNGGLHTFDGKVTFSALMIDALIMKAGHTAKVLKLDNQSCRIRFTRGDRKNDKDYEPFEYEYTIEKAKNAGYLSKKNWQTSLDDMLYSRCITGGARKHMAEVMVGVLVTGELVGDDRDGNVVPMIPATAKTNLLPVPTESVAQVEHHPQPTAEQLLKQEEPVAGFDDFVEKHGLRMNEDGSPSSKRMEYVVATMKKTNMGLTQLINTAIKHEKIFDERFEKWVNTSEKISV